MKIAAVSSILIVVIAAVAVPTTALVPKVDDSPTGSSRLTPQGDPDRYIVVYSNNRGRAQTRLAAGQVHVDLPDLNAVAATIPPEEVEGLRNNPNIESIEQDLLRFTAGSFRGISSSKSNTNHADTNTTTATPTTTTRSLTGTQQPPYGIPLVQADQVPMGSSFVPKICIIDSGFNLGHEDLPGVSQVTGDFDIGGTQEWFQDGCAHGTHVAGTVAAANNAVGVVGVCPGCKLHIVRVFGDDCYWAYSSDLVAAAMKCKEAGANIISMSLGGSGYDSLEDTTFNTLLTVDNILIVAAAGNGGDTSFSYPASYDSVMSVAALDDKRIVAGFSQKNSQVDISAPGVGVISTVPMGSGFVASVTAIGSTYEANNMDGSVADVLQAELFNCGIGDAVCTGATDKICLIQRGGGITFAIKVENCHNGGGIGAIIYNNVPGIFSGTLGAGWTIITTAVSVSDTTGAELLGLVGMAVTISVTPFDYDFKSGTSMATPHVSGVAGLIWSHDAAKTAQQIRDALTSTALDLGPVGRDDAYGFGNVHACNAAEALGVSGLTCSVPSSVPIISCGECSDGIFCNGLETCDAAMGRCLPGTEPCSPNETCDENSNTCLECVANSDCNDGSYCNGDELCANGRCQPGSGNPCDASHTCDENADTCVDNSPQCSDLGVSCQDATDCCSGRCAGFPGKQSCK